MINAKQGMVVSVVAITMAALMLVPCAFAGEYHYGTKLSCNQCHLMHGSYNGTDYNGGTGFPGLLKNTVNALCLGCHDGTSQDIVASGTAALPNDTLGLNYNSDPYSNSSGFFQSDWATVASPEGHDLGPSQVTATQGSWTSDSTGMKCTDCHDPHGNPNFRNIRLRPGTAGADINVREGTEVELDPSATTTATSRATAAVHFNDPNNITQWCMGCHSNITTGNKHPQDAQLSGGAADAAHWVSGTGTGFGTAVGDSTAGIPRVRFAQAGTDYASCGVAADTNRVFCLSCHKAHGSKYDSTLVWPHYTDGAADQTSACGQCHNKGG